MPEGLDEAQQQAWTRDAAFLAQLQDRWGLPLSPPTPSVQMPRLAAWCGQTAVLSEGGRCARCLPRVAATALLCSSAAAEVRLPAALAGVDMRPYQREGLAWLAFLRRSGLHGVLADDMVRRPPPPPLSRGCCRCCITAAVTARSAVRSPGLLRLGPQSCLWRLGVAGSWKDAAGDLNHGW